MRKVEHYADFRAVIDGDADRAEDKKRAGIIAEGEQALTLGFRQIPAVVELAGAGRAERVAGNYPQNKRRCTRAADIEQRAHHRAKPPRHHAARARINQQRRADKKRKKRRREHIGAQRQPRFCVQERALRVNQNEHRDKGEQVVLQKSSHKNQAFHILVIL